MHNNRQFDKIFEAIRKSILKVKVDSDGNEEIENMEAQQDETKKPKKSVTFRLMNGKKRSKSSVGFLEGQSGKNKHGGKEKTLDKGVNTQDNWSSVGFGENFGLSEHLRNQKHFTTNNRESRLQHGEIDDHNPDIHQKIRQIRDYVTKNYPLAQTKKYQSVPLLKKPTIVQQKKDDRPVPLTARSKSSMASVPSSASKMKSKFEVNSSHKTKDLILSKLPTTISFFQQKLTDSRLKQKKLYPESKPIQDNRADLARSILKHQIMKKLTF